MSLQSLFTFILLALLSTSLVSCGGESGAADPVEVGEITKPPPRAPRPDFTTVINQTGDQVDPTTITPIEFRVVFGQAIDPATFTIDDIVQNGSATGVTWEIENLGNNQSFTLKATTVATEGTVEPWIDPGMVQDPSGANNLLPSMIDGSVFFDAQLAVIIEQRLAQVDPALTLPIEFDVMFTSPIDPATFVVGDITQNGTATGVTWNIINSGDDTNFTLQATAVTGMGTVIPSIAASATSNPTGAQNNASTSTDNEVTYRTKFDVTVDQKVAQADPTASVPIEFDVVFSEAIDPATFDVSDITQNGTSTVDTWTITNSGDDTNFTLRATVVSTTGTVTPSIADALVSTTDGATNNPSTATDNEVTYSPKIDVTIDQKVAQADPTASVPIEFDVVFSEAIDPATFTTTDITQNGTATVDTWNIINSGDDTNFTLQATAISADGTVIPSLADSVVQTVAALNNTPSTSTDNSVTYDTIFGVTVNQKVAQTDPTATLPIEFDVVFEEAIDPATFTTADITQSGTATIDTWNIINSGDDTNFTLQATAISADGTVIPTIAASAVQDPSALKNNSVSTATDNSVTYNTTFDLTINQKVAQADPTNAVPVEFDIVFSEAIDPATFTTADITQSGTATVDTWNIVNSGDDTTFTLQATAASADGTIQPTIAASTIQTVGLKNNNTSTSTDNSVTYDVTFDVTIDQKVAQADPTTTLPVEFDVVFSEAIDPATFTTADITQDGSAVGVVWNIINSGDDTNFTLQATATGGDGTIEPSLSASVVQTVSLKNNNASTATDNVVTLDTTFTVTVEQNVGQADPTAAVPVVFDIVFEEAIDPATFTTADITQNGTATGITWNIINSGDDTNFTLQATSIVGDGTVQPELAASAIQTLSGKNNIASTSVDHIVTYNTKFDVTINQKVAQEDPTATLPIEFDVVFSEAIAPATFTTTDITQNGTATGITWNIVNSGDDTNFTLQATTVTGEGTVDPSLAASTVQTVSLKDNNLSTSTDNDVTYDTTFGVQIEQKGAQADPTGALPIEFDIVFEEAIDPATFTTADITQNGTATGVTWNIINSGDDTIFTLQATATTSDGTVVPSIAASTIQTTIGKNNNLSTSTDNSVTYSTSFTITIEQKGSQADPASAFPVEFDVVMQRAIVAGTFTTADITQDGTATGVTWNIINSGDDINFTLQATNATATGTIVPSIGPGLVTEVLGSNLNSASTSVDNSVSFVFPATQLKFVTQPANTPQNGTMANFTVEFRDASNNLVSSETSDVTIVFGTDPTAGTASIAGTTTVTAVGGVATFNNISIDTSSTGFTFTASSGTLSTDTSTAFDITFPVVTSVTPPANAQYSTGQNLDFTANMSAAVTVTGTPQIQLDIGDSTVYADYQPGLSNSTTLVFRYTIQGTDADADGIQHFSPILLSGGTIQDSASNNATLTFTPASTTGVTVITATPGITVSGISGATAEDGTTATFTVVLDSAPSADVVIGISSDDTTEGLTDVASLTFTTANWNTPQLVTVTGQSDVLVDGPIVYHIVTAAATSTDGNYNGLNATDVTITNLDTNAAPNIVITAISGNVSETGTTATFSVYLATQPTADVTFNLSSNATDEGTIDKSSLTFTSADWSTAQVVTVTGVDDILEDGDQAFSIITDPATSSDANYNGMNPLNVVVINEDDDSFGISVTALTGNTDETGKTATFTVKLKSAPTGDVTIPISSSDPSEGTVDKALLTFTTANWSTAQTVTVTGINDALVDGDQIYIIQIGTSSSTDPIYNGIDPTDLLLSNIDDDTSGINVSNISNATNETGSTATFSIVLTSPPTDNVTIPITSSDTTEGTVDKASVTFTPANWSTPQIVTVTGVDDAVQDGNQVFFIQTDPDNSTTDNNYNGLNPIDVTVTNNDDDSPGIFVTPTAGINVSESGTQGTFTVVLGSQPAGGATVTVNLTSTDTEEVTLSTNTLVFTDTNWASPQTVSVTGVDDALQDGTQLTLITLDPATSADPVYNGIDPLDVYVNNLDDDTAGFTVTPTTSTAWGGRIQTSESGTFQTFSIVLNSAPSADVTINLSSSDTTEGTVSPTTMTFTPLNWNSPQSGSITGVDDASQDGIINYTIITSAASSSDGNYNGLNPKDIYLENLDDDSPGVTVLPNTASNQFYVLESGTSAQFTVVLDSQPSADVTVNLSSDDTSEGAVTPTTMTFTPDNWNVAQTGTGTGVDDTSFDGNRRWDVTFNISSSDNNYNGITPGPNNDVEFRTVDDERADCFTDPDTSGTYRISTSEDGTQATFAVILTRPPTDDVIIPTITSSDTNEGIVTVTTLTFTPSNWSSPQYVTITGVDDGVIDGTVEYTVNFGRIDSNDGAYDRQRCNSVNMQNLDND